MYSYATATDDSRKPKLTQRVTHLMVSKTRTTATFHPSLCAPNRTGLRRLAEHFGASLVAIRALLTHPETPSKILYE